MYQEWLEVIDSEMIAEARFELAWAYRFGFRETYDAIVFTYLSDDARMVLA